jgi:hypothetical protein
METLVGLSLFPVRFIRPTYGRATAGFLEIARELNLEVVGWHTSSEDWLAHQPSDVMLTVAWQGVLGKVVLFHDSCADPEIAREVLGWLLTAAQRSECRPVTLQEFSRFESLPGLAPMQITRWTAAEKW